MNQYGAYVPRNPKKKAKAKTVYPGSVQASRRKRRRTVGGFVRILMPKTGKIERIKRIKANALVVHPNPICNIRF